VVHVEVQNLLLGLTNAVEDEGLALVTTVDTHTEELLLGVGILLVLFVETEDGVSGGRGDA